MYRGWRVSGVPVHQRGDSSGVLPAVVRWLPGLRSTRDPVQWWDSLMMKHAALALPVPVPVPLPRARPRFVLTRTWARAQFSRSPVHSSGRTVA